MHWQVINTDDVRRETLHGDEHVVAPVTLLQPMHLNVPPDWGVDEAYLPSGEARNSAPEWNGTPLTLNHPSQNGVSASANQPQMHDKTVLGRVFNAEWTGDDLTAEAWFNTSRIRDMGGAAEQALESVLNGATVEVSTGYRAEQLPAGNYDGKERDAVQGNIRPDHVAVLPNQQGKCSVADGCGVGQGVAANDMIHTNVTNQDFPMELTNVAPGDVEEVGFTDREWDGDDATAAMPNPSEDEDAAEVLDQAHVVVPADDEARDDKSNWLFPFRAGPDEPVNTRALVAIKGSRGVQGTDAISDDMKDEVVEWVNTLLADAPDDLFGADGDEEAMNRVEKAVNALADVMTRQPTTGAESPVDTAHNSTHSDFDEGDVVQWQSSGGMAMGVIRELRGPDSENAFDEEIDGDITVTPPAALIEIVDRSDEGLAPTGTMVAHKTDTDTLSMVDDPPEVVDNMANRETLIAEITENSELTETTLHGRCMDGLEAIHNDVMSDTDTSEESDTTENSDAVVFDSREEFMDAVEEVIENREEQTKKERLAEEITANSQAYDETESVLEDYPTVEALKTKRSTLESGAVNVGRGAAAQPATNDDADADSLTLFGSDKEE